MRTDFKATRKIPNKWESISSISFSYLFIVRSVGKENISMLSLIFIEHLCSVL